MVYPSSSSQSNYKTDTFAAQSDYIIHTIKKICSIVNEATEIQLLDDESINRHKMHYNYLHLALVQIALKPLIRKRMNVGCLAYVRDKRFDEFDDSLLGLIEVSLSEGPIFEMS